MAKPKTIAEFTRENAALRAQITVLEQAAALSAKASTGAATLGADLTRVVGEVALLKERAAGAEVAVSSVKKELAAVLDRERQLQALFVATDVRATQAETALAADLVALAEAKDALTSTQSALKSAQEEIAALKARAGAVEKQNSVLSADNRTLQATLESHGHAPVISPAALASMTSSLLDELSVSLPGMAVTNAELKLKLAVTAGGGFVVPSASADPPKVLHEVAFDFTRLLPPLG